MEKQELKEHLKEVIKNWLQHRIDYFADTGEVKEKEICRKLKESIYDCEIKYPKKLRNATKLTRTFTIYCNCGVSFQFEHDKDLPEYCYCPICKEKAIKKAGE